MSSEPPGPASSPACPDCGGYLGEPVSGPGHCHRRCDECGASFQLDDPRLTA